MKRLRFTISALMGGVLLIAIGLASLTNPTPLGANVLGTFLHGSLVVGVLGTVLRRGPRRAFWISFVVCGGAYTLFAFDLSPTPSLQRPQLVTTDLLVLLKDSLSGVPTTAGAALNWMTTARKADWELFAQTGHTLIAMMIAVLGGFIGHALADDALL